MCQQQKVHRVTQLYRRCGPVIKIWELCLIVTLIWHLYERSYDNHNFMWVSTEKKTIFFDGCCWFKFINFRLALGMTLKFYASVTKRLKLKFRKFWELILMLVEVTGEKPLTPILNRLKVLGETGQFLVSINFQAQLFYW